ncbi:hypothetical protein ABL78_6007 [Leptomonas seymouri]|uniref:Uncharacterized protein n=1 Tax=Leptomonas seymouri TaxID=5684 RepID=A0A0N1IIP5_LEPSE|nr:hypothetical protein ABL78_6007 [Leptomonas seymouri]|eukprot:KPI84940.1 hypothetical protein ABL78_6007 [Leptomonas seymouri]
MLVRVAKTATSGVLRRRRLHAVVSLSCFSSVEGCVAQKRRYCTETRLSLCSSQARTSEPFIADEGVHSSPSVTSAAAAAAAAASTSAGITSFTAPQSVAEVVKQLQRLASSHFHPSDNVSPISHDEGAGVDVSADALADFMVAATSNLDPALPSNPASRSKGGRSEQSAWEVGLQLADRTASSAEVAEWLLFLCLRSQGAVSGCPAPLEVCEGVYQAWRQRREAAAAATERHAVECTAETENSTIVRRSPFEPKGVHHHYAMWLLKELHSAQRVQREMRHRATVGAADALAGSDSEQGPTRADDALPSEFHEAEVVHQIYLLLNRVLEVLLIDHPKDGAAVPPLPDPTSSGRRRRQRASAALRPTSALLVLEAARQLAQLSAPPQSNPKAPDPVAVFPILLCITARQAPLEGQGSAGIDSSTATTPLADVARAAFEVVLRIAPPPQKAAATAVSAPHDLLSDAVMLYLGFLMASAPPRTFAAGEADLFVCRGSFTARQLPGRDEKRIVDTEQQSCPEALPVEDHVAEAVAAAVRVLLSSYLGESSEAMLKNHAALPDERNSTCRSVVQAFDDLLFQPTPATLWPLFNLQSHDDATLEQRYTINENNRSEGSDPTQPTTHTRPISWCAWLIRVLLYDLERAGRAAAAKQPDPLHHRPSGTLRNSEADQKAAWQRRSEQVITIITYVMMQLRQQYSPASPVLPRHLKRYAAVSARRTQQDVWRLVFQASSHGCFFHSSPADYAVPAVSHHSLGSPRPQQQQSYRLAATAPAPPVLLRLCFPYYDNTQWRRPSVNLYVSLLDQWGQGEHVRQVFADVARREGDFQAEVQAAVAAESASKNSNDATAKPLNSVFRRYRPALHLHSCLTALKYCGCPSDVLAMMSIRDETPASRPSYRPADASNIEESDTHSESFPRRSSAQAASDARLAGKVLQYMLCTLHVVEHNAIRVALRRDLADPTANADSEADAHETTTLMAEGHPIAHWIEWVGGCCVPAVEQLYRQAGLEEEWDALGY